MLIAVIMTCPRNRAVVLPSGTVTAGATGRYGQTYGHRQPAFLARFGHHRALVGLGRGTHDGQANPVPRPERTRSVRNRRNGSEIASRS